jgi:glycosyltransferase involved in cell wall biosynthesis
VRVLIDTTFALRGPSGTGVYLERVIAALQRLDVDVVEAANTGRRAPGGGPKQSVVNLLADRWWTTVELPRRARHVGADLVHHPLPAIAPLASCPQVVTVHDLAFERLPDRFAPAFRSYAHLTHRAAARRAAAVIAVSETTAADVMSRWGIDQDKIVIARHGPGQEPDVAWARTAGEHFLYVGDDEPRKNLSLLRAAYRLYREQAGEKALRLVLAGSAGAREGGGEEPGVEVVERPEPERLAALYARAAALVHPSLHEGFGLTPLEAMSAGVPVVAARSPGVVEVCAEAVVYVDPHDPRGLATQLDRLAHDAELRKDLSERGRRRAAEFSWARSARAHVEAYTLAMNGGAGPGKGDDQG